MDSPLIKIIDSIHNDGLGKTSLKIIWYIFRIDKIKSKLHAKSLKNDSRMEIFSKIYKHNYWGSSESVSGSGSTVELTPNLRNKLPQLFEDFKIGSVYDAPCGNFNWMRHLVSEVSVSYTGADIVPQLIDKNNKKYRNKNINFETADITISAFPKADLWICRDCLFHLSYRDIVSALENYVRSEIPYILTSTHINDAGFYNNDILTGDFRLIDLFSPPFCFPREPLYRIADWVPPHSRREMCMWSRSQISEALPKMRKLTGF